MNKYAAAGLIAAAETGRRILVISHTRTAAREAFDQIAQAASPTATVHRTHGREHITLSTGGTIHTTVYSAHARNTLRWHSVDTVYLEWPVDVESPDVFDAVRPCIATSRDGEIIRA